MFTILNVVHFVKGKVTLYVPIFHFLFLLDNYVTKPI